MNNLFKRGMILFALVFAFMVLGVTNVSAQEELDNIENVPVINHVSNDESTIDVFFTDEIPYVKLTELYNLISTDPIEVKKLEEETYEVITLKGSAIINTKEDNLYSDNYGGFCEIPDEEDNPIVVKDINTELIGEATPTTIDFTKYEIDLYGDAQDVWLPLTTAFDMFMKQGYYDGKNINILDNKTSVALLSDENYYDVIDVFLKDNRVTSKINNLYNELCFVFDNYYGYPTHSILSKLIKTNGLDYALEHYNEETKAIKEKLISSNFDEYYYGLTGLEAYLYDNGHTSFTGVLSNYIFKKLGMSKYFELDDKISEIEQYNKVKNIELSRTDTQMNIKNNRENLLEDKNYIEKGDTALYIFDGFDFDGQGWNSYYNNGQQYPNDTLGNILNALDKASQNSEIKNFVFDISNNSGGLGVVAPIIMDFLGYDNSLQYKNMINNQIQKYTFNTDTNFDGIYTDEDKISKYNFNYGVLTSDLTFSTGNILASLAKENGFMILGEQSSGGACAMSILFTNESILYTMSSPKHIVDKDRNSVDNGVIIDANLVEITDGKKDYSKYYDLDNLRALLNEYYKTEEKKEEINEISDNAIGDNITNTNEEKNTITNNTDSQADPSATVYTTNNPRTGDNIMFYISMLGLSIIGIVETLFLKRLKIDKQIYRA